MKNIFKGKGLSIKGVIHLSPSEAYQEAQKGAMILDIREEYDTDYKRFNVPEVLYCPYRHFEEFIDHLPGDRALIVAASTGLRSKEIVEKLMTNGFLHIANLNGGMVDWERDGLPIKVDKNAELHGQCVCRLRRK
jgi:rhodanese-related sulfurtransferase